MRLRPRAPCQDTSRAIPNMRRHVTIAVPPTQRRQRGFERALAVYPQPHAVDKPVDGEDHAYENSDAAAPPLRAAVPRLPVPHAGSTESGGDDAPGEIGRKKKDDSSVHAHPLPYAVRRLFV